MHCNSDDSYNDAICTIYSITSLLHMLSLMPSQHTCLGFERLVVKDGHPCGLTAGTRCSGDCRGGGGGGEGERRSHGPPNASSPPPPPTHLPHIRGFTGLVTGRPFPMGALTKSSSSLSGLHRKRLAAFAVSITEPPPTATKPSKPCLRANSMASSKLYQIRVHTSVSLCP